MTLMHDLRDAGAGVLSRIRRLRSMAARATAVPLTVRGGVWFFAFAAFLAGFPFEVFFGAPGLMLLALAALPALAPRTQMVTLTALLAVFGWVVNTQGFGQVATLGRLTVLTGSLYLLHSGAALAAHLPYDAFVSPGVLLRWSARAGLVLLATAVLAGYVIVVTGLLGGRTLVLATLVGLAVAVGVATLLARQLRER